VAGDPMKHKVEITGTGTRYTVKLDDEMVMATSVKLDMPAGSPPQLTITPVVFESAVSIDGVVTQVPPATHDLLVRLGWTAPQQP
jgi:hypothetical protein